MNIENMLSGKDLEQINGGSAPSLPAQTGSNDPQTALDIFDEQVRKALEAGDKQ